MARGIQSAARPLSQVAKTTTPSLCPFHDAVADAADSESDDSLLRVVLPLFRFIGAAYTTGVADCWEAAYLLAEETTGISQGSILVARVATLVRIFRGRPSSDAVYLPPCCKRLSKHEARLMEYLRTARGGVSIDPALRLPEFADPEREAAALGAIAALSELSFGKCPAVRPSCPADLALRESAPTSRQPGLRLRGDKPLAVRALF